MNRQTLATNGRIHDECVAILSPQAPEEVDVSVAQSAPRNPRARAYGITGHSVMLP